MELLVGEEVFECHKVVLCARSPVFMAMFQSGMKESNTQKITINDMKTEVVAEMLKFIYTGNVSNANVLNNLARDLLSAANHYQLNMLKGLCEDKLCENLDVSSSVELLVLGDLHQASKLKSKALKLLTQNIDKIVNTDVYKDLLRKYPDLSLEVTKAAILKQQR